MTSSSMESCGLDRFGIWISDDFLLYVDGLKDGHVIHKFHVRLHDGSSSPSHFSDDLSNIRTEILEPSIVDEDQKEEKTQNGALYLRIMDLSLRKAMTSFRSQPGTPMSLRIIMRVLWSILLKALL